jgi:large subunit ribosomal protein L7e
VKEYSVKEKGDIRLNERHKTAGDFYIPAQPKVYFVIPECGGSFHLGLNG